MGQKDVVNRVPDRPGTGRCRMNEKILDEMEGKYPTLLFTQSEARGLTYITESGTDFIALMVDRRGDKPFVAVLAEKQAKALSRERSDMLVFIGRGRKKLERCSDNVSNQMLQRLLGKSSSLS